MREEPTKVRDEGGELKPFYLYHFVVDGTAYYLTTHDRDVTVQDFVTAGNDILFSAVQIGHSKIRYSAELQSVSFRVTVPTDRTWLQTFFLNAPSDLITVAVYRAAKDPAAGDSVDFDTDVGFKFSGRVLDVAFSDNEVQVAVGSLLDLQFRVARYHYQRQCQARLYGRGCLVTKASHQFTDTVTAFDRVQRYIEVDGTYTTPGEFDGGELVHDASGKSVRMDRVIAAPDGSVAIRIYLQYWINDMEDIGEAVTFYRGCDRTVGTCDTVFSNKPNIRAMPYPTDKNLAYDGIA